LIAELCKGFDWFRQLKLRALLESDLELMQLDSQQLTPNDVQQQLPSCLTTDYETRLLQQLSSLPDVQLQSSVNAVADLALEGSNPLQERSNSSASASSSRDHCPASSQSSEQPIAPSYDPLYLFQLVFSKPPSACCNNVEAMTLDQLRAHYKALVRDLSLYLMQHQTGGMAADDQPLDKIQAALVDHLHLVAELCFAGGDLVMSLQLVRSWLWIIWTHVRQHQLCSNAPKIQIACFGCGTALQLCLASAWRRSQVIVLEMILP
jgi:hypothetical protein